MIRRTILATAVLALVSTCCPTLWLTLTKNEPIPRAAEPLPAAATDPIPMPPRLDNRCDVLAGGKPCVMADRYTDHVDLHADTVAQWTEAVAGLRELDQKYGGEQVSVLGGKQVCLRGTVRCTRPAEHAGCLQIKIEGARPPGPLAVVTLGNGREIVASLQNPDPDDGHPLLATALDAPDVTDNQPVQICFGRPTLSRTLLSFIHMSDIQLRDSSVKLEDAELSKHLDWLLPSTEYDPDMQAYDRYVAEALFTTVNAEVRRHDEADRDRPSFIVHTGDSIDAGVTSELRMFHTLVHTLAIPLFEVVGNHDALTFGNLVPTASEDDRECATVKSIAPKSFLTTLAPAKICVAQQVACPSGRCTEHEAELVAQPTHGATLQRFIGGLQDSGYDALGVTQNIGSTNHGFDLNPANRSSRERNTKGYYYFFQSLDFADQRDGKAIFVVLDAEDLDHNVGGVEGRIGKQQAAWLHHVIACEAQHPSDLMLVFAHQPLGHIAYDAPRTLEDELSASPNMVGYFYGHFHEHRICDSDENRRRPVCSRFWEVETGSLIEFPQEARMVRIKQVSSTLGFLEVSTFAEHLDASGVEFARLVSLARRGAERDWCRTHPDLVCSDDLRPYRTDGRHTNARLFFRMPGPSSARPRPSRPRPARTSRPHVACRARSASTSPQ